MARIIYGYESPSDSTISLFYFSFAPVPGLRETHALKCRTASARLHMSSTQALCGHAAIWHAFRLDGARAPALTDSQL